jgi:sarcosine oxidase gamma subunit
MDNLIIKTSEQSKKAAIKETSEQPSFGTVVSYSGGKAKITIDGDTASDGISYVCIKSCTPSVGDRVFFIRTGTTLVIIGVV